MSKTEKENQETQQRFLKFMEEIRERKGFMVLVDPIDGSLTVSKLNVDVAEIVFFCEAIKSMELGFIFKRTK